RGCRELPRAGSARRGRSAGSCRPAPQGHRLCITRAGLRKRGARTAACRILTPPAPVLELRRISSAGARCADVSTQTEHPPQTLEQARLPAIDVEIGRLLLLLAAAHFGQQIRRHFEL